MCLLPPGPLGPSHNRPHPHFSTGSLGGQVARRIRFQHRWNHVRDKLLRCCTVRYSNCSLAVKPFAGYIVSNPVVPSILPFYYYPSASTPIRNWIKLVVYNCHYGSWRAVRDNGVLVRLHTRKITWIMPLAVFAVVLIPKLMYHTAQHILCRITYRPLLRL